MSSTQLVKLKLGNAQRASLDLDWLTFGNLAILFYFIAKYAPRGVSCFLQRDHVEGRMFLRNAQDVLDGTDEYHSIRYSLSISRVHHFKILSSTAFHVGVSNHVRIDLTLRSTLFKQFASSHCHENLHMTPAPFLMATKRIYHVVK